MGGISIFMRRRGIQSSPTESNYIRFEDKQVEQICVANFSSDGIGLTIEDAAAVTNIGFVFAGNTDITSFKELQYFTGLTYIAGDTANGAFKGCTNLGEVVLPDTIKQIRWHAFTDCTNLKMKLPISIESIQDRAFWNSGLDGDIYLPNLKGTISRDATFQNTKISSISSLGSVTEIGGWYGASRGAFYGCKNLESVNLPDSLIKLTDGPFWGCTSLKQCYIPESITTIGEGAFYNCTSLYFDILNLKNLISLGQNAFYGVKIKKLVINALTRIPAGTTSTQNFGNKATLEEIVLSEDITTIPTYAFLQYKNLRGVVNHPNLTSIGACAYNTTAITRIEDLGSITTILGGNTIEATFGNCASLSFVRLPATLTAIGRQAFYACKALEIFICAAVVPPSLDSTTFSSTNSTFIIYVPDESVEAYRIATNWSAYASRIYPLSNLS